MFLLDTDHLSILQRPSGSAAGRLKERLHAVPGESIHASIVSFHEQVNGWSAFLNRSKSMDHLCLAYRMLADAQSFYSEFELLPFDQDAARRFEELTRHKTRVATLDLRIASIALSRGMTLLTRNTIDFARIPGLNFEDWTADDPANGSH